MMRHLKILILFFSSVLLGNATNADTYDVYLLAGQSNMDGRGLTSELKPEQLAPLENVTIFYRNPPKSSDGWQPLGPGFSVPPKYKGEIPSHKFGPELGFARALTAKYPDRKIALIKGSKGGSSLRVDWNPGTSGQPKTQGERYRFFQETIETAVSELKKDGHEIQLRGLLWHQGESDSKSKQNVYQKRLVELIARIREDVKQPDLPVVIGEVFDNGKRDSVRAAQRTVGHSDSRLGFASADGLTCWDEGTHFDAASQLEMGERFASEILRMESGRPAKPNVVMILADDLGWQDVGCYDIDQPCPYETPNIDRLAGQGVKFWQAYSPAPTCAPSRAAILSGRHPARTQKTHVVGGGPPTPYAKNAALIAPWYSGRMKMSEVTIAEALNTNGYTTGHVGKWHCAINHYAFPQPMDQGFDFTRSNLGVTRAIKPNRLADFATDAEDDPYRLDENGFPFHQNSADAITFLEENKAEPFFLYHATWLVHAPIHTRSERLLRKYSGKMKVPFPTDPKNWNVEGQKNPYYGSMVEMLDYYVGQTMVYLDETDDPRWPGHKLAENTYVIFTSDNGGFEKKPGEFITDNYPLDKGKINAKEGGTRVPLIIRGPGISANAESSVMINGLDFYPTILSWTGTNKPAEQHLDGINLAGFLNSNPSSNSSRDMSSDPMIRDQNGKVRDTMFWHFPHSSMQSTIRVGGYKLIRNWEPYLLNKPDALELYQLYDDDGKRVDIEEANNLAATMPEKAAQLHALLEEKLAESKASPPFLNPNANAKRVPRKGEVCQPLENGRNGDQVWATFDAKDADVVKADLIYTNNGGDKYEEWYRLPAKLEGNRVEATLPADATHYVFNFIDENHFLVSYPNVKFEKDRSEKYSARAIGK